MNYHESLKRVATALERIACKLERPKPPRTPQQVYAQSRLRDQAIRSEVRASLRLRGLTEEQIAQCENEYDQLGPYEYDQLGPYE